MNRGDAVQFLNPETGRVEDEPIYGERFLRFIYERPIGAWARWALCRRALFSHIYGFWADMKRSRKVVPGFIERYGVQMSDFVEPEGGFLSFNDFFTRRLAPGARPIDTDAKGLSYPADARHSVLEANAEGEISIKGQRFDLATFLGNSALAERYQGGSILISRLCPVDYHRFHFPCAGDAGDARLIEGAYYSVNPIAIARRPSILWENKRIITELETADWGRVQYVEVGATCVGSVQQSFKPGPVHKGQEKGLFRFGGSTTVLLFEPGAVLFGKTLHEYSARGVEVYGRMGERIELA